jgi:hypothetical protein
MQLSKALLVNFGVQRIRVVVDFENIGDFSMKVEGAFGIGSTSSKYIGPHEPISREVNLSEIHDFDGEERNVAMPIVWEIMDEASRIFGFSKAWAGLWDSAGKLAYVKGLENQR